MKSGNANPVGNIGFISTRIAGNDGVSLEIGKWARVLERNGCNCFYFSGENDRPPDKCMDVDEAHFLNDEIQKITGQCFSRRERSAGTTRRIQQLSGKLKRKLYEFIRRFDIDIIIPENALSIPLNIPLGLALTEMIAETAIPTVAHHHDFSWERERFLVNAAGDYLCAAFPPNLNTVLHVVINSPASSQLSYRRGISNIVIPNVYDFASPPPPCGDRGLELKKLVGLGENDLLILQPTRLVPRKWVERSLEIVHYMKLKNPVLVVSHSAEDEGDVYYRRIIEYADILGVRLVSIEHLLGKGVQEAGEEKYDIGSVYECSDLVTYPSGHEGFGNAFLETIYHRKPIVLNRYSIYIADIEPKGFDVITIDGFVTGDTIDRIKAVLNNEEELESMTGKNYRLGLKYFSFEVLEDLLLNLISTLKLKCGE